MHPVRVAIFLALLGAHVLGILYFASLRGRVPDSFDNGFATAVFFVEDKNRRLATQVRKLPVRMPPTPTPVAATSQRPLAPAPPVGSRGESTAPIAIDWAKEAQRVAADPGLNVGATPAPATRQQFGWDYAHTHRLALLPEGGLIANLSDRCSIVFKFPLLLGGCKIGKIEARGDLFAHMHEESAAPP
jgi:hypothetical protein